MKILIEAMHGMGDIVCMIPKFELIKQQYPKASYTVLFNNKISDEVVRSSSFKEFDSIIINVYHDKLKAFKQCFELRKEKYDICFFSSITPIIKYKLFAFIINPKECVAIQNRGIFYDKIQEKYHFVDADLLSIGLTDIEREKYRPRIYPNLNILDSVLQRFCLDKSQVYIGISIGSGDISYKNKYLRKNPVHTRGWGNEDEHILNMCSLVREIVNEGYSVILFGGILEKRLIINFPRDILVDKRVINLVGCLNITESIAVASICSVMVGVDTGMQHVSDALNIPTVSIFGPTNPLTHGAYSSKALFIQTAEPCKYCYATPRYVNCVNRKCLSKIKVLDVMRLINKQLEVHYGFK